MENNETINSPDLRKSNEAAGYGFLAHKEINMQSQPTVDGVVSGNNDDVEYDAFLQRVQARFVANISNGNKPLFTTDAEGLFSAYLCAMPEEHQQYHTCHACRQFVERFGGLVTIDEKGATTAAFWNVDDAPDFYKPAITAIERLVRRAKVTGVFLSADKVWWQPLTGEWHHMAVTPPASIVHRRSLLTAGQSMAEKREDFRTMITALQEFSADVVAQAVTLLKTESLYRSEKCLGAAEWLANLHGNRNDAKGKDAKNNILWLAVATAPAGFCHPRSSMIGTLLEDIAAGLPFDDVKRKFADKMHPLQYHRPQAAPSVGNIAQAEKIVKQLGIAASLKRRFARLDEIEALWLPAHPKDEPKSSGVFSHLQPKSAAPEVGGTDIPAVTMTWDKFQRTVLPDALEIEFFAPHGSDNYIALVTAVDPEAPPILQWDVEGQRNPVSWYVWHGGSSAVQWGLVGGCFHRVSAVTLKPSMWHGGNEHQGAGVVFILKGAKESRTDAGLALFPETLKSELREIRSTIEAFSRNGQLEGVADASACGIALMKGSNWNARFRVRSATSTVEYKLDRWD